MKTAIFCVSVHHGNTAKLASVAKEALGADLYNPEEMTQELLEGYDLAGFFSGIYKFRHHEGLFSAVGKLPQQNGKKAFICSTSGSGKPIFHRKLAKALNQKGFHVIAEYVCRAYITFGPFGLVGGINKGRPDANDLAKAALFFKSLTD